MIDRRISRRQRLTGRATLASSARLTNSRVGIVGLAIDDRSSLPQIKRRHQTIEAVARVAKAVKSRHDRRGGTDTGAPTIRKLVAA